MGRLRRSDIHIVILIDRLCAAGVEGGGHLTAPHGVVQAAFRDDPFYRYTMPLLETKIEGRGNGVHTVRRAEDASG
jgi:hypothetical protein